MWAKSPLRWEKNEKRKENDQKCCKPMKSENSHFLFGWNTMYSLMEWKSERRSERRWRVREKMECCAIWLDEKQCKRRTLIRDSFCVREAKTRLKIIIELSSQVHHCYKQHKTIVWQQNKQQCSNIFNFVDFVLGVSASARVWVCVSWAIFPFHFLCFCCMNGFEFRIKSENDSQVHSSL